MNIMLDDAFQFGLGVFETICLKNGKPEFLEWHLDRINTSLNVLGINSQVNQKEVAEWLETEIQNGADVPELHAMKIMISDQNKLMGFRSNPYTKEEKEKGFRLEYSSILRNETSPLVYYKTMNYGDNIIEKRRALREGIDEVIFLNTKGEICEGSTTNIFFQKGDKIYTPPVTSGLLPGIMRRYVIENYDVKEKILYPEDVVDMDSCFVTNSLMGIMKVVSIGEKQFCPYK